MQTKNKNSPLYCYKGSFHLHSNYSDGTCTFKEIAVSAKKAGLDFVIITDHGTLQPLRDGLNGYLDNILILVGYEINDEKDKNHLIALDLRKEVPRNITPQEYVNEVRKSGGIGIIAHPNDTGIKMPNFKSHEWTEWDIFDYDGIEIWNYMMHWLSGLSNINKLFRFFFPNIVVNKPAREILTLWDELNKNRKVFGIFATDNHGFIVRFMNKERKIFSYTRIFNTLRIHILLNEPLSSDGSVAQKQIFNAIRKHMFYNSDHRHGDANGVEFNLIQQNPKGIKYYPSGSVMPFSNDLHIQIKTPKKSRIKIYINGILLKSYLFSREVSHKIHLPGNYRVECHRYGHPWIMSNNIFIR